MLTKLGERSHEVRENPGCYDKLDYDSDNDSDNDYDNDNDNDNDAKGT
ncbi:hypothetical protein [uncultured Thiodictyon sp.]|nr:hypothetical protein [uncultured Thiodictyon sp.]